MDAASMGLNLGVAEWHGLMVEDIPPTCWTFPLFLYSLNCNLEIIVQWSHWWYSNVVNHSLFGDKIWPFLVTRTIKWHLWQKPIFIYWLLHNVSKPQITEVPLTTRLWGSYSRLMFMQPILTLARRLVSLSWIWSKITWTKADFTFNCFRKSMAKKWSLNQM